MNPMNPMNEDTVRTLLADVAGAPAPASRISIEGARKAGHGCAHGHTRLLEHAVCEVRIRAPEPLCDAL